MLSGHQITDAETCPDAPEGAIADKAGGLWPLWNGIQAPSVQHRGGEDKPSSLGSMGLGGELGFEGRSQALASFQPVLSSLQNNPSWLAGVGGRGWAWLMDSGLDSSFTETCNYKYPQKQFF